MRLPDHAIRKLAAEPAATVRPRNFRSGIVDPARIPKASDVEAAQASTPLSVACRSDKDSERLRNNA